MGLAKNTIIVFSSDNGPEDYRIRNAANGGVGNSGTLRARKRSMYEGGIRTLGLVRWPGQVPAGRVDPVSVVSAVDLLPTIAGFAGAELPADLEPDGEDLGELWRGGEAKPRKKPLHWEWMFSVQGADDGYVPPMLTVRDGDWKLFLDHEGGSTQLYRITDDPGEENDLASTEPEVVKALTAKALAWVESLPPSPARDTVTETGAIIVKVSAQPAPTPPAPGTPAPPVRDRRETFRLKDTNGDGTLTLGEYLHRFPDQAEGRRRYPTFDTDGDGLLTEEEFVRAGR